MSFFQGANNTTINGGTFAAPNPAANVGPQNDIVALLYSHSARAGLLDAKERFDAPKCDEGTRVSMIRAMKAFVQHGSATSSPGLYWLHGPAGVGKSALAQSVSLELQREGDHAASFFFSRTASGRNNGNQLVVTLAYQLAKNFPALQPFMSNVVKTDPGIFDASNAAQMQSLIVDPINEWHRKHNRRVQRWTKRIMNAKRHPRLILVDGLDECNDPVVQTDLIRCIASAVRQLSIPLRFVVSSRPESHILAAFELNSLGGVAITKKNLGKDEDADEQITTFLLKEFAEIRRTHPIRNFLPPQWPRPDQIGQLVAKSSKGFIYPTTVSRYIKMAQNRPDLCLDRILGMSELPTSDKPYEPLDILYRYIFESVSEANKRSINDIFHLLVLPHSLARNIRDSTTIEQLFKYPPGHVQHVLHDLLCLVELTPEGRIKVLHASLPDFLLDKSRSGPLWIDIGDAHATHAAHCLMINLHGNGFFFLSDFKSLLDHLQKANNSNDLLNERILQTDLVQRYKNIPKPTPFSSPIEEMAFITAYLIILLKSSGQQIYIRNQTASLKDYVFREYPLLRSLLPEFISVLAPQFRDSKSGYPADVCRIFEWKFDSAQNELREAIFETFFLMVAFRYQKEVPVSYPQPRLTLDGPHYWADIVYPPDVTRRFRGFSVGRIIILNQQRARLQEITMNQASAL